MKLLHLLPDFGHHAVNQQVELLAAELTRAGFSVQSAAPETGRRFDPGPWWHLRGHINEFKPDVVHAWRLPMLRAVSLLRPFVRQPFHLVVSEPLRGGSPTLLDRWVLRHADADVAAYPVEAERLRRLGVASERLHVLPPVVSVAPTEAPPLGVPLPPGARIVMCVGALTPSHGFRDAVWAADILKYPAPDVQVVIVGDGPERDRLRQFIQRVHRSHGEEFIHLLPARPDAAALLARADVVWVPSHAECGRQVALEALAAGRPVVATALPGLAALVSDGVTGLLAPPGDPPTLVKQTRRLLENGELAGRLGEAARQFGAQHTPERVAPAYIKMYDAIAAR